MTALTLAAFVAGALLLQWQADLPPSALLAVLAAAAPVALLLRWRLAGDGSAQVTARAALLALAALIIGFGYAALRAEWRLADELPPADEGRDLVVVGVIDSLPSQLERGTRFEFAVEQVLTPGAQVPARISLGWYGASAAVVPAERWRFTVRLKRPHGLLNPGGFDLEAWMLERGLRASGYVRDGRPADAPQRLDRLVVEPGALVDRARHELRRLLQQQLRDARWGGVLVALVLGDQRAIREDDWLLFNRTGIAHLVSISGLHITMIAGLAAWLAAALWRRAPPLLARAPAQSAAAVAGLAAAFGYCLLAGWGVPAQRTFFMLCVVALALVARVPMRPTVTLALAAAVVTLLDPWATFAPGFWLSFGAVAAILLVMHARTLAPAAGWRARLVDAAYVQGAVTVALVPLTVALFQQVSLVSPLANAVAIPLVSLLVTPLALVGALLATLPAPLDTLAVPALAIGHWLFALLGGVLQALGAPALSIAALPAPPAWALAFAAAGVLWLLAPRGWPLRWLGLLWLLPLVAWPPERPARGELWVTAIDIGQGAAVLLETQDATVLYDTGPRWSPQADAGGRTILPYLRWRGIGRLDLLVVSHLDSDHSGGAASIVRGIEVGAVLTSVDAGHPALGGAPAVQRCERGQALAAGALSLAVLHPPADDYRRANRSANAMSCVLVAAVGDLRVLLPGDLSAREEGELLARAPLARFALVAAPHHGSRHSSSQALVDATRPRWVLAQSGYRNRFGHPAPEVAARWQDAGAVMLRTDLGGAVQWRLRADGGHAVTLARAERRRYWHDRPALPGQSAYGDDDESVPASMPAAAATEEPVAE